MIHRNCILLINHSPFKMELVDICAFILIVSSIVKKRIYYGIPKSSLVSRNEFVLATNFPKY